MAVVQYTFTHKTIYRTTQNKQYIEQQKNFGRVWAVPHLCELYPGICLTTEEKAWINLSQGSQKSRCQWPCILQCWSATTHLLRLQVQFSRGMDVCLSLVSVVCCQVEVSAVGQSLIQSSPTSVVCLKWGLHKATVYTTHQWVQSPARETAVNILAMPIPNRNGKTGQSASST